MTPQTTTAQRARLHDPLTSQHAAAGAERFAGKHAARIIAALEYGIPRNAHEIGEACGLTVVQVDRRTVELQRKGLIRVKQVGGADFVRDGMRVWELA